MTWGLALGFIATFVAGGSLGFVLGVFWAAATRD
jgi:hypothetical protein